MIENGVLILECLADSDPGSEGRFLSHMFKLMKVKHQYVEAYTRYQLLALLKKSPFRLIHIATHGAMKDNNFGS